MPGRSLGTDGGTEGWTRSSTGGDGGSLICMQSAAAVHGGEERLAFELLAAKGGDRHELILAHECWSGRACVIWIGPTNESGSIWQCTRQGQRQRHETRRSRDQARWQAECATQTKGRICRSIGPDWPAAVRACLFSTTRRAVVLIQSSMSRSGRPLFSDSVLRMKRRRTHSRVGEMR